MMWKAVTLTVIFSGAVLAAQTTPTTGQQAPMPKIGDRFSCYSGEKALQMDLQKKYPGAKVTTSYILLHQNEVFDLRLSFDKVNCRADKRHYTFIVTDVVDQTRVRKYEPKPYNKEFRTKPKGSN